jgi:hypothetical protein
MEKLKTVSEIIPEVIVLIIVLVVSASFRLIQKLLFFIFKPTSEKSKSKLK